jgi:hypothetical protein
MIPKKLKIGGKWVEIKLVEGEEHFPDGEFGMAIFKQNIIKIDSSQKPEEQMSTLLHEIIEYINYMFELKLEHSDIMCLEVALYQVLKDNKLRL